MELCLSSIHGAAQGASPWTLTLQRKSLASVRRATMFDRLGDIDGWELPLQNGFMRATITIDNAGRVVIPKNLRDDLGLKPGDSLEVSAVDHELTLRPVREATPLVREMGVWVYRSGAVVREPVDELINRSRESRFGGLST